MFISLPWKYKYAYIQLNDDEDRFIIRSDGDIVDTYRDNHAKWHPDKDGYLIATIYLGNCRSKIVKMHRELAKAFIKIPKRLHGYKISQLEVNHKNGIKYDNRLRNLEWVLPHENTHHAFKIGLRKNGVMNEKIARKICKDLVKGKDTEYISKKYNVPKSSIRKMIYGVNWKSVTKDFDFSNVKLTGEPTGSLNGNGKLTEKSVKKIKKKLRKGIPIVEIAKEYNVSATAISSIKHNKTWKHVK